jgi:soluble lytic murein transglycosylase
MPLNKYLAKYFPDEFKAPTVSIHDSATHQVESGGRQFDDKGNVITSKAGALGIAQIMPTTAPEAAKLAGVPYNKYLLKYDADYNAKLGSAYLKQKMIDFNGDVEKGHAAYNAGSGNVKKAIAKAATHGGSWKDYLPDETKNYIVKIALAKRRSSTQGNT